MIVAGFFTLLAVAVLTRLVGNRLVPVLMPGGRFRAVAFGWAGGLAASWVDGAVWQLGPEIAGVNLVAAFIGSAVAILCLGIAPFVRILIGKG